MPEQKEGLQCISQNSQMTNGPEPLLAKRGKIADAAVVAVPLRKKFT